jgi:3-phosphoshikimate 1-carboxyvinyltransferase
VTGAARLRLKESDRLTTTAQTLNALGGDVEETEDGLIIRGKARLAGGTVDAQGDHRIVMLAAVASVVCDGPVTITGAEAIRKSYPTFWDDLRALGKEVTEGP